MGVPTRLTRSKVKCEPSTLASSDDVALTASESEIPRFAQSGWVARFLPTLCHRLSGALDPWDIGDGADVLFVIQGVFDKAYPDSGYKVTFRSKVYLMVRHFFTNILTRTDLCYRQRTASMIVEPSLDVKQSKLLTLTSRRQCTRTSQMRLQLLQDGLSGLMVQ